MSLHEFPESKIVAKKKKGDVGHLRRAEGMARGRRVGSTLSCTVKVFLRVAGDTHRNTSRAQSRGGSADLWNTGTRGSSHNQKRGLEEEGEPFCGLVICKSRDS